MFNVDTDTYTHIHTHTHTYRKTLGYAYTHIYTACTHAINAHELGHGYVKYTDAYIHIHTHRFSRAHELGHGYAIVEVQRLEAAVKGTPPGTQQLVHFPVDTCAHDGVTPTAPVSGSLIFDHVPRGSDIGGKFAEASGGNLGDNTHWVLEAGVTEMTGGEGDVNGSRDRGCEQGTREHAHLTSLKGVDSDSEVLIHRSDGNAHTLATAVSDARYASGASRQTGSPQSAQNAQERDARIHAHHPVAQNGLTEQHPGRHNAPSRRDPGSEAHDIPVDWGLGGVSARDVDIRAVGNANRDGDDTHKSGPGVADCVDGAGEHGLAHVHGLGQMHDPTCKAGLSTKGEDKSSLRGEGDHEAVDDDTHVSANEVLHDSGSQDGEKQGGSDDEIRD
jgi:hypothetical protein